MKYHLSNSIIHKIKAAKQEIIIACAVAAHEGPIGETGLNQLIDRVRDADAAVQGNRSNVADITWSDTRLVLAATLRTLLVFLEEER